VGQQTKFVAKMPRLLMQKAGDKFRSPILSKKFLNARNLRLTRMNAHV